MDPEQARKRRERNLKRSRLFNQRILGEFNNQPQQDDPILPPSMTSNLPSEPPNLQEKPLEEKSKNNDNNLNSNDNHQKIDKKPQNRHQNSYLNEIHNPTSKTDDNIDTPHQQLKNNHEINHQAQDEKRNISSINPTDEQNNKTSNKPKILSLRSISFLIAPLFAVYPIPYGFAILLFIDVMTFVYMNLDTFETFTDNLFSSLKQLYDQIKLFPVRFTCLQFLIILTRIFLEIH